MPQSEWNIFRKDNNTENDDPQDFNITINVIKDMILEPDEMFCATLSLPTGCSETARISRSKPVTITIVDVDSKS